MAESDPRQLGVHPAITPDSLTEKALPELTKYIRRPHDLDLDRAISRAASGSNVVAVLVGGSSTGKTRAMWEAVQKLPSGWVVWHPLYPTPPEAVLDGLRQVAPRTVIWLDEAQLYLNAPGDSAERVAAALRSVLADSGRRPIIVLGSLWPTYWDDLTREGVAHPQARALLDGTDIAVPPAFVGTSLMAVQEAAASDPRLAAAAAASADGQVTQYLAGVPELLSRYHNAPPAAGALINAAMDACRLGCGSVLPQALLEAAAPAYLTDAEWDAAGDDWGARGLRWAGEPCKGVPGPLTQVRPRPAGPGQGDLLPQADGHGPVIHVAATAPPAYRLADYLDQYGRSHRADHAPHAAFWASAADHAYPDHQAALSDAAYVRGLYRTAAQLRKNATACDASAAVRLIEILHLVSPDDDRPCRWAADYAPLENPHEIGTLLRQLRNRGDHEQITALLRRDPAGQGALDNPSHVAYLLRALYEVDAGEQFITLANRAAAHAPLDNPVAVSWLLAGLYELGARAQVTVLLSRDPAAHTPLNDADGVIQLARHLRVVGGDEQATALINRAVTDIPMDNSLGVASLLRDLPSAGYREQVATLLRRDPATHVPFADSIGMGCLLTELRRQAVHEQVATLLKRDPAAHVALTDPVGVARLLTEFEILGARQQFTTLASRAAGASLDDPAGVTFPLRALHAAGADEQFTTLASRAAADAPMNKSIAVAELLGCIQETGTSQQFTTLASRAAPGASLDNLTGVAFLLGALHAGGADGQFTTLASRAAAGVPLSIPAAAPRLLREMRNGGAGKSAEVLTTRLIAAGIFQPAFEDFATRFPFGCEPDGRPGTSWGWDDLS